MMSTKITNLVTLTLRFQLILSSKCYGRAVQLEDTIPGGWYDLALINFFIGKAAKEKGGWGIFILVAFRVYILDTFNCT